jgi:hypothetical protein
VSLIWVDPTKIGRTVTEVTDGVQVATPWLSDPIDLARERKKRNDDRTDRPQGEQPPEGEIGSAWDRYRIYAYYENGNIFEQGPIETADLEDMISKDGIARGLEQALTLPLRSLSWTIKAAPGDTGEAAFVREVLTKPPEMGGMEVPMQTIIGQMTSARLYKRAHFEKVFRVQKGQVTYQKIAFRPPTTCYLARAASDASFQGFMQWTWAGLKFIKVIIPKNKAFVFLHGEHRNPLEGITDLDVVYNAWQSKQKLRFLWYQFLETQASPRTVAKKGTNDDNEANALAKKVASLKGGGVVGLIAGDDVTIIESNGLGASQFSAALAYIDQEMLQSALAAFLGLAASAAGTGGGSGGGSYALSSDLRSFFLEAGQAVAKEMQSAITWGVIQDLVLYNFGVNASCPTFEFAKLAEDDTAEMAYNLLSGMVTSRTPTPLVPWAFIDDLVKRVAQLLDMDVVAVEAALTEAAHDPGHSPAQDLAPSPAIPPADPVVTAINGAHALVTSKLGAPNGTKPAGATASAGGFGPPA